MAVITYKDFWNHQARSEDSAITAVDGSHGEDIVQLTGRWSAEQVRSALDIGEEDTVLELGCGIGRIGRELAPYCCNWIGVDISENMIHHAGSRMHHLDNVCFHRLIRSDLAMLQDSSIDKAYSIAVFCHMDKEDLYLYMQELNRVIKPGGIIFVETWNLAHPIGWRRWTYEARVWARANQQQRKHVARNQFCTPQEFELYINHAGFQTLAVFDQSQSVQIMGGKQLNSSDLDSEKSRVETNRHKIGYSKLYAELFAQSVDVLFKTMPPAEMLEFIDSLGDVPEAGLFRPYLLSLWRNYQSSWGKPPE
jgi:ubiquinone/menaquinone biosynthesis C-methylase UbiE